MDNNINNNDNCITNIELFFTPHVGKFGIILSILGAVASALLGYGFEIPASIVMGIINIGIFIGGICFERLQIKNHLLLNDNVSLKQDIKRRQTILENFKFNSNSNDINNTNDNNDNYDNDANKNAPDNTPHCIDITPKSISSTYYEPVYIVKF